MVLVDSRVTHNFISEKLVDILKISVNLMRFAITLRDNHRIRGSRKYVKVKLTLEGILFT